MMPPALHADKCGCGTEKDVLGHTTLSSVLSAEIHSSSVRMPMEVRAPKCSQTIDLEMTQWLLRAEDGNGPERAYSDSIACEGGDLGFPLNPLTKLTKGRWG